MKDSTDDARKYFAGLTEFTFHCHLGVADARVVDYMTNLLMRFLHTDELFRLRGPRGNRLSHVYEMLGEANHRVGVAQREVYQHIGDFTLFWTGVYPEALKKLGLEGSADPLLNYRDQGRRSYHAASKIPGTDNQPRAEILESLSRQYDLCAYGLGEIRREWEHRTGEAPDVPLLGN